MSSGQGKALHSQTSDCPGKLTSLIVGLLLLCISLRAGKKDHRKVGASIAVFSVDQNFLGYGREGGKLCPHHVAPFAADLKLEAAIQIGRGDVFFAGERVGCAYGY